MPIKILFAPNHPKPILDVALALKPPGFDLMIHDNGTPEYYRAAAEAEYYLGATRSLTLHNAIAQLAQYQQNSERAGQRLANELLYARSAGR